MRILMTLIVFLGLLSSGHAQELFVFPNEGQDQDQQDLDEFQCQRDATNRSGFDPMAQPQATRPPPEQRGGAGRGALGGALLGTAVGAVAGDTRRGAAIGAASGGLMGGTRRADSNRERDQWAREQANNQARGRDNWNRAFIACMEARGYTVR
jgi:hypothetical protein